MVVCQFVLVLMVDIPEKAEYPPPDSETIPLLHHEYAKPAKVLSMSLHYNLLWYFCLGLLFLLMQNSEIIKCPTTETYFIFKN